MKTYEMRNKLNLQNYNTEITRKEFEEKFYPTKERIIFTFQGWDGKSYDGESRTARIYRTNISGYEEVRLVKVGKHLHTVCEDSAVLEKATGEYHKTVTWLVDVKRAK